MSNYYSLRRNAFAHIDKLIIVKAPREVIELDIMRKFGLTSRFVEQYLNKLSENKVIHYEKGVINYEV